MSSDDAPTAIDAPSGADGVFPSQLLRQAIDAGYIDAGTYKIPDSSVQPASLDLRLGERAYRIRCSFLPDTEPVETKVKQYIMDELDLRDDGAVLETGRPYLIPLVEELNLPPHIRARTNPKSSTGRLDVFTRVITDESHRFDEIASGYRGKMYLEVVPLSFTVKVKQHLALNQLRLLTGQAAITDDQLQTIHGEQPILFRHGRPVAPHDLATANGLFLSLDLRGSDSGLIGYRAKEHAPLLEMGLVNNYPPESFWEEVRHENGDRVVLDPGRFYLLLSDESVTIPPDLAAEMTAYDPTSGELRTHYAGFFDPGFGYGAAGSRRRRAASGSRAALEVRAHDVPFMIEHGQPICKLTFERMIAPPDRLYGTTIGSNYQGQVGTLGKHFQRPRVEPASS